MDYSRLRISIPYVTVSPNESVVHKYCIEIIYGKLEWKLYRRFSEFHSLNNALCSMHQFDALPPPPPKLFLRSRDQETLEERRIMLENWIRCLAKRPDVRTSPAFVEFIEFESNTNTPVEPLAPSLVGCYEEGRFKLSDMVYCPEKRCIITSFEESAGMARVGKVWSLIEAEVLGSLSVFEIHTAQPPNFSKSNFLSRASSVVSFSKSEEESAFFDKIVHMTGPHKFHKIYFSRPNNRFFVALHSGIVQVYKLPSLCSNIQDESQTLRGFEKETELNLHTEAILSIHGDNNYPGRFVTAGYDNSIRIVNCESLETISGGNLSKRFEYKERITLAILECVIPGEEQNYARLFIGTNKGNVLIFSLHTNPPEYRTTISCSGRIGALELAGHNLLVAHKNVLSIYRIGRFGRECEYSVTCQLNPNLSSGGTISSIAVSITVPLLFLGHTKSITVWDCHEKTCVAAFKAHTNGVQCLRYIGNSASVYQSKGDIEEKDDVLLLSAGGDSCLRLWMFRPVAEYMTSTPKFVDSVQQREGSNYVISQSTAAPVPAAGADQQMSCNNALSSACFPRQQQEKNFVLNKNVSHNTFNTLTSVGGVTRDDHESDEDQNSVLSSAFLDSIPHRH